MMEKNVEYLAYKQINDNHTEGTGAFSAPYFKTTSFNKDITIKTHGYELVDELKKDGWKVTEQTFTELGNSCFKFKLTLVK